MNEGNVNPANVNPHFDHTEKFGLSPSTVPYDFQFPWIPQPVLNCRSCGACPTCGRSTAPVVYGPSWISATSGYTSIINKNFNFDAGIPAA